MPTEHTLLYELVKEIADGKWDGGISAPALRDRARLIVYGVADCKLADPERLSEPDALYE